MCEQQSRSGRFGDEEITVTLTGIGKKEIPPIFSRLLSDNSD